MGVIANIFYSETLGLFLVFMLIKSLFILKLFYIGFEDGEGKVIIKLLLHCAICGLWWYRQDM